MAALAYPEIRRDETVCDEYHGMKVYHLVKSVKSGFSLMKTFIQSL